MSNKESILNIVRVCSAIVCKKYGGGNIKPTIHKSYVELNISENYDACKDALCKAYDFEILSDNRHRTVVVGNPKTKTIRIIVTEI